MATRLDRIGKKLKKRMDEVNAQQRLLLLQKVGKDDPRYIRLDCNVQSLVEILRLVKMLEND